MTKQNVLRAILNLYLGLLEYEGRLHTDFECLLWITYWRWSIYCRGFYQFMLNVLEIFENKKIKELFEEKKVQ